MEPRANLTGAARAAAAGWRALGFGAVAGAVMPLRVSACSLPRHQIPRNSTQQTPNCAKLRQRSQALCSAVHAVAVQHRSGSGSRRERRPSELGVDGWMDGVAASRDACSALQ